MPEQFFQGERGDAAVMGARDARDVPRSRMIILCDAGSARMRTTRIDGARKGSRRRGSSRAAAAAAGVPGDARPHRPDARHVPFNGHTTSFDALWMGVPVVSLCGETSVSAGRVVDHEQPRTDGAVRRADEAALVRLAVNGRGTSMSCRSCGRRCGSGWPARASWTVGLRGGVRRALRGMWRAWCAGSSATQASPLR
jgi:hypothetical protein